MADSTLENLKFSPFKLRFRGLFSKFLLVLLPVFLILEVPAFYSLIRFEMRDQEEFLATRIGSEAARVAAALGRHGENLPPQITGDLLAFLATDRAFVCAELRDAEGGGVRVSVPPKVGCTGQSGFHQLVVPVGETASKNLVVRFSAAELEESRKIWQSLTFLVVVLGFLISAAAASFGFHLIVNRPLGRLLGAIQRSASTGERVPIAVSGTDEFSVVTTAFNDMLTQEIERERELRETNERLRISREESRILNLELEERVQTRTAKLQQREADLLASQARLRNFVGASSDWFWEMDKDLRFSYFSEKFETVTGVSPDQLLGKTREETGIPDVDPIAWSHHLSDLAAHRPFREFEHPRTLPDGTVVQLSVNGVPVFDENGNFEGYAGTGSDITARHNIEAQLRDAYEDMENKVEARTLALRESQARFRDFAETGGDWLWEMDADLRFTYMSANVERIVGVPPEWHYGKTREDILGDDFDRTVWGDHLDKLKAHKPFRNFTFLRAGDGVESKWLSSSGKPIFDADNNFLGYRGTGSDVTVLKEREAALAESERRFRDFAQSTADWFWEVDEGLRFTYLSPAAERALGISAAAHIGRKSEEILGPARGSNLWPVYIESFKAREPFRDFTYRPAADSLRDRWVRISGQPVFDSEGSFQGYRGTGSDVTELTTREVALQRSENNLREVLERSPLGVAIVQVGKDGDRFSLRRLFVNDAVVAMLGFPSHEAMIAAENTHDETWVDPAELRTYSDAILSGRTLTDFQAKRRRIDGTEWVASLNTRPVIFDEKECVMVGHHDITERVKAENALAESEAQHRLVTNSLPVMIIYVDAEGRYRFVNETGERWYGKPRAEIIGRTVEEIYPGDYARLSPHLGRVLNGENFSFEDVISYGDGVTRDVYISFVPHHAEQKTVVGYFALVEDITERKHTEAALRQAQKMEAVGQLTGGVAHDFNNLLGVIVANLDFLAEELEGDQDKMSLVEAAIQAAESGAKLNRQLLAFSRKQSLQTSVVDLNQLLGSMSDMLGRALGETISVRTVPATGLSCIDVDSAQLESALLNLAVNARQAMPDGGRLTIETANIVLDEAYAARNDDVRPGHYAMLAVSDTGLGMSTEVQDRVFEPFFTTKEVGEGTGLGLSMVFGFVKQSGGHVSVYSEMEKGTTVKLFFPISETAQNAVAKPAEDALPLARDERILIVEDDEDLREVAIKTVSSLGYQVEAVPDALAALAMLDDGATFDLLFTDIVLPHGMSGVDLGSAAKTRMPELAILYTSGYTENKLLSESLLEDDTELLSKPYRRSEVAQILRKLLDARNRGQRV